MFETANEVKRNIFSENKFFVDFFSFIVFFSLKYITLTPILFYLFLLLCTKIKKDF